MSLTLPSIDAAKLTNKVVLLRVDINVPVHGGKVTDNSRIVRLLPTLKYLIKKKAKIVLLSHFDRPGGKFVPSLSLAPLVDAVSAALSGKEVKFGVDCIGPDARAAVDKLKPGEVLLLENLRFHPQEEKGDRAFAKELASLGDVYVNDAFSASHRAHASITGITEFLPSYAGFLMREEVEVLSSIFSGAEKPIAAIIGESKVSTKLELLNNLSKTVDIIVIGGAMANTFLYAQGHTIGKSRCEPKLKAAALKILANAKKNRCEIILPCDVVVAQDVKAQADCRIVASDNIPLGGMAVDVGPASVERFVAAIARCKTVVWNGPLGAFETSPFDVSTVSVARSIAALAARKKIRSIAGGGDTVAALVHAGLAHSFGYISTAGGAFLEWLEGKKLPGVAVLIAATPTKRKAAR